MNIHIDPAIFTIQQQGGISRLWRSLLPALRSAMPDATFDRMARPDVFLSTYYARAPLGTRSIAMVYDCIGLKYPLISPYRSDMIDLQLAVSEAQAVIAISRQTAQDIAHFLGRESVVAYPGVDEYFGQIAPSTVAAFQKRVGSPYLLVVGNRGLYKNVQALYQAWAWWEAHRDYRVVCVGGEDTLPQDRAFAQRYEGTWLQMRLHDDDLRAAYAGAAALIYPSLMEGFGLPVIEAMAAGCPVICDPALREVGGEAAFYCSMTQPQQIAAALNDVLDAGHRLAHIQQGLAWAKRFRWTEMARIVAGVIREVAA